MTWSAWVVVTGVVTAACAVALNPMAPTRHQRNQRLRVGNAGIGSLSFSKGRSSTPTLEAILRFSELLAADHFERPRQRCVLGEIRVSPRRFMAPSSLMAARLGSPVSQRHGAFR
jgi:hypothetical protein